MLKKNWECHSAMEHIYGTVIKRWYIKSPSGNYYFIYRSNYAVCMSTGFGPLDYIQLLTPTGSIAHTFHEAIKTIYAMEKSGSYEQTTSVYVKNLSECVNLFATKKNLKVTTY